MRHYSRGYALVNVFLLAARTPEACTEIVNSRTRHLTCPREEEFLDKPFGAFL